MKKFLLYFIACFACTVPARAAVRDAAAVARSAGSVQNSSPRAAPAVATTRTTADTVSQRAASSATAARSATTQRTAARNATTSKTATGARTASSATAARSATTARAATTPQRASASSITRSATAPRTARAAVMTASQSNTFGTGYNACRDAYFTCMDQFCANQNPTYRRCICSSRLDEIQSRERALSQAANQIQDFKDLNIEVINKTAAEVKAMLSASAGEYAAATAKDTSDSAQKLAGISEVLNTTKSKSLSTAGQLDIAGDINAIWATTDLTSGAAIANLTGEALYNAVHSQCAQLVADNCTSQSTLNMVISAYGMYIENDCNVLANSLSQKKNQADGILREAEREMNLARLENYNAHNSTSINECIAQVRSDITADTACGKDYVHCLDISGKYLSRDTGEPIYTADFYQLETMISLSGDILTNQANRMIVAELNSKRAYAARGLDTCRDLADEVWDEFMRQAITEIYQGQQERIRQVKNNCLEVVNNCYDTQSASLKDFSNVKDQLLLGSRLELSEQMCREKLDACSNLYGGGPDGLQELLTAMRNIIDQKIAKECRATLQEYARDMCAVPGNDSLHAYPYACRVYAPGEQKYAGIYACNQELFQKHNTSQSGSDTPIITNNGYSCPELRVYTRCKPGYVLTYNGVANNTPIAGNLCTPAENVETSAAPQCGEDYVGSLYQKMVRYAMQTCMRPSTAENPNTAIPATVLEDINVVMDSIRIDMKKALSTECDRLGGYWVDAQWQSSNDGTHTKTGHTLWQRFYNETGANTKWGYCADKDTVSTPVISTTGG